ncbi:MAG TPA: two-component regulator propeller domain-containing protein [Candidatus Eisenbacteria bacterium]|nr:two-component regulator propeller domain-containing protein [Candidatus Eisenbacteria bacterium]
MICRLKQTRWTVIGIALAGLLTDARALDPNRLLSQYVREQWTTESRFPGGAVNGIAQTADGYLWIGTDRGLIRFDGFNFRPVSFASSATASNVPILQLLTDAAGKLWIRPQGGDLVRQKDGKFESVRYGQGAITAVSKDKREGVLVSDIEQGTFRFTADHVQKLGPDSPPVISMTETADGKVWLGTLGDGLFFLTGGRATQANTGLPDRKINCLLAIGSDELWVGTGTGLYRGNGKDFRRIELPPFLANVQVLSLLRDRDSNIWVGTTRGLLRINAKGISFSEENELRGDGGINALFEDREGNLWIGGGRGLGRIRDSAFVTYSAVSDRRFENNGPVYGDPEGRTWFAPTQGGLYILQNGHVQAVKAIPPNEVVYSISGRGDEVWVGRQRGGVTRLRFRNGAMASRSYTQANGLAQNSVYAVYESGDGSAWAGTLNGGVSKLKNLHFTTYKTTDGLASNTVSSILETRDGAMWFATPSGLSSLSNGQWRTYTTTEGLPSPEVNCLFEDSSGTLWSGTSAGLAFFASNRFRVPDESPEVLHEQVVGMAEDKSGRFWIATPDHVLRVPRDKLLSGVVKAIDVHEYGQADGLASTGGVKRSRSVISDSAGRIWFSLSRGLSVVNPSQITDNSAPALPHIEAVFADGSPVDFRQPFQISTKQKKTTFRFVALSLANSERVRYRYRLDGFDHTWSDPVASREATYTNLGAASYKFRVIACNSDGLWDVSEAAVGFEVEPTVWQTWWFRTISAALILLLAWCVYLYRLRQLAKEFNIRLEERIRERTRIARDLHDTLLQSFHGLLFRLQAARNLFPGRPAEATEVLDGAITKAEQAIAEGRDAIQDLRPAPVAQNDLEQLLTAIGQEIAGSQDTGRDSPNFSVTVEGARQTLSPILQDEVYRIACEVIGNAFRHANASQIEAEVRYDDSSLRLRIRDDGKGTDPKVLKEGARAGHWGLPGIRERAKQIGARLEFWSKAGAGTEVELTVPASIAYAKPPDSSGGDRHRFGLFRKKRSHERRS